MSEENNEEKPGLVDKMKNAVGMGAKDDAPADAEGEVTSDAAANEAMGDDHAKDNEPTDAMDDKSEAAKEEGAEVYKVPQAYRAQVNNWKSMGLDEKLYSVNECEGEDCFEVEIKDGRLLRIPAVAKVLAGAAKQKVKDDGEKSHENHKANAEMAKEAEAAKGEEASDKEVDDADEGGAGEGEPEE